MTKTHRNIVALLACAVLLPACGPSGLRDFTEPTTPTSGVKFFNFAVGSPQVNFYANDTKLTAGGTGNAGTAFGAAASGGLYVAVGPAQYTFSGRNSDTTSNAVVSQANATVANGKWYSYYQSGLYNTTSKTADAFVVEDDIPTAFDYSTAYVRLVNAIYNANPMTLYATSTDSATKGKVTTVGGAVAYKSAGAFTAVAPGTYDLATQYAGSSTSVITRKAQTFSAGEYYTITAYGDMNGTTTAKGLPTLDNTANR